MTVSPLSMKCETCLYYAHLPYQEKGYTCNTGVSRIRCTCPKIPGPTLSLATLSNFLKPSSTHASVTPDTAAPPPPTILDNDPGARRCLVPSLGACCRLDPSLRAHCCLVPDPEHATINLKHAVTILILKPIIVDLTTVIADLNPASLGLCLSSAPAPRFE
jgi:hypothetical protein